MPSANANVGRSSSAGGVRLANAKGSRRFLRFSSEPHQRRLSHDGAYALASAIRLGSYRSEQFKAAISPRNRLCSTSFRRRSKSFARSFMRVNAWENRTASAIQTAGGLKPVEKGTADAKPRILDSVLATPRPHSFALLLYFPDETVGWVPYAVSAAAESIARIPLT